MGNNNTTNVILASGRALLVLLAVVLILFGMIVAAVWYAVSAVGNVSVNGLKIWAVVATLAIPLVGVTSYRLGRSGARAWIQGITDGLEQVDKVSTRISQAGAESASLRGQTAASIRQATQPVEEPVIELPRLEGHYQLRESLPSGETVEME